MTVVLSTSRQTCKLVNLGTLRTHSILVTCSKGEEITLLTNQQRRGSILDIEF